MSVRQITFTNGYGSSITIGNNSYTIEKMEGLGNPDVTVYQQKAPYQDGTSYIDCLLNTRNIVIYGAYGDTNMDVTLINQKRAILSSAFNQKAGLGKLVYTYTAGSRQIYGLPKLNMPDRAFGQFFKFMVTVECYNPWWQDITESSGIMAIVTPLWEFPFEIDITDKFEFGSVNSTNEYIANNLSDFNCPVKLQFYGPALNPKIENKTTGEYIHLTTSILEGEYIEISTEFGNKYANLYKTDGTIVDVMDTIKDLSSTFWTLQVGNNTLGFSTDDASLTSYCIVTWRNQYLGV